MHHCATWDTFVFLQESVPRWFRKCTTVELLGISGSRKQWQYCRSISIGRIFDRMSRSTSDPALPMPLRNWPSRSKASMLHCLSQVDLGNPSPWITCCAFLILSMATTVFLWSSTNSRRWPLWRIARRISQQKPLLNSSLNGCGYTLGSHSLSSQIGTTGSSIHFGPISGWCWTPSSLSPQLSIPKLMAKKRFSIWWSYTYCACKTQSIHTHGIRAFPMSNTAIIELSIARLATTLFRWAWDSSHYVPLMWPYHLHLLRQIRLISSPNLTRQTTSLLKFNTFSKRSMTYLIELMISTSSDMIDIGCHKSSRWVKKFGYICRRSALLGSTVSFAHSDMGHTPSPRK